MGSCQTRGSSRREEEMGERLGEGLLGRGGGWRALRQIGRRGGPVKKERLWGKELGWGAT